MQPGPLRLLEHRGLGPKTCLAAFTCTRHGPRQRYFHLSQMFTNTAPRSVLAVRMSHVHSDTQCITRPEGES